MFSSRRTLDGKHDFAELLAALEIRVGFGAGSERKDAVHNRFETAFSHKFQDDGQFFLGAHVAA